MFELIVLQGKAKEVLLLIALSELEKYLDY